MSLIANNHFMYWPLVNLQVFLLINLTMMAKKIIQLKYLSYKMHFLMRYSMVDLVRGRQPLSKKSWSTKIRIIDLLLCSHNKKQNQILSTVETRFQVLCFLNFWKSHKKSCNLSTNSCNSCKNCWNYPVRHDISIISVDMVLSCIILILVANWQGIFG